MFERYFDSEFFATLDPNPARALIQIVDHFISKIRPQDDGTASQTSRASLMRWRYWCSSALGST